MKLTSGDVRGEPSEQLPTRPRLHLPLHTSQKPQSSTHLSTEPSPHWGERARRQGIGLLSRCTPRTQGGLVLGGTPTHRSWGVIKRSPLPGGRPVPSLMKEFSSMRTPCLSPVVAPPGPCPHSEAKLCRAITGLYSQACTLHSARPCVLMASSVCRREEQTVCGGPRTREERGSVSGVTCASLLHAGRGSAASGARTGADGHTKSHQPILMYLFPITF